MFQLIPLFSNVKFDLQLSLLSIKLHTPYWQVNQLFNMRAINSFIPHNFPTILVHLVFLRIFRSSSKYIQILINLENWNFTLWRINAFRYKNALPLEKIYLLYSPASTISVCRAFTNIIIDWRVIRVNLIILIYFFLFYRTPIIFRFMIICNLIRLAILNLVLFLVVWKMFLIILTATPTTTIAAINLFLFVLWNFLRGLNSLHFLTPYLISWYKLLTLPVSAKN